MRVRHHKSHSSRRIRLDVGFNLLQLSQPILFIKTLNLNFRETHSETTCVWNVKDENYIHHVYYIPHNTQIYMYARARHKHVYIYGLVK